MRNRVIHHSSRDQFVSRRGPCLTIHAIAGFIDHRLERADRAIVEQHLLTCEECIDAVCVVLEAQREIDAKISDNTTSEQRENLYRLLRRPDEIDSSRSAARMRLNSRTLAGWSLRSAAVLAVCLLGYQTGIGSAVMWGTGDGGVSGSAIGGGIVQPDRVDPTFGLFDDSTFWIEGDLLTAAISGAEVYHQ